RFSTLVGFAVGCLFLALVSLFAVGWAGCWEYIKMLLFFTQATTGAGTVFRDWKYVDVASFFRLLLRGHVYLRWALTGAAFLLVLPLLFRFWWKADRTREPIQSMVWAFTITWTLVLNLYLGIYDTTLVILSLLLTANTDYRRANNDGSGLSP